MAEGEAVDEVERWLAPLGLAQLAPVLRANDVDLEVLPELSEADLEKLGLSLGQRKKLLKAVGTLPRPASSTAPTAAPARSPSPAPWAERRQLTVMFCDLVGSTALSSRLDPEDLRDLIGVYQKCVAETVDRFDGFVAKYMGDGVLVYFGYPQAHEDDAERAVRAGLAVAEAVAQLAAGDERLAARVGIATGLTIVGDLIGTGAAQEQTVVGETPNLAARLQALAEPSDVVIAESTHALTRGFFEYEDLGLVELKGLAASIRAWRVSHATQIESRFEALRTGPLPPLVGRGEEVELLLRRWHQAKAGEGRVVMFSGEPGIGKSRLTRAIQDQLREEHHARRLYFCSPHHQSSALFPFISELQRAAMLERDDPADRKLDKLEQLLKQSSDDLDRDMPLLAELLSIPLGTRFPVPNLAPQKRKQETFRALIALIEGMAAQLPVLLIFEDAHWIDPTSLELLHLIIERVQTLPVLLVITSRPEFAAPWAGRSHVTMHPLSRLSRREGLAIMEPITGGKSLPQEVIDRIAERTDGVPLFIEELTKAVLESNLLRFDGDRYVLTSELHSLGIPTTLHASLMARLDRVPLVREAAEIGAAIGREFSHELIVAVSRLPQGELEEGLTQLVASGLALRRGTPPEAVYAFKHALVQDAAYSTLLRGARQELHARIAVALEERFPDTAEAHPELVAQHCTQAGLIEKAAAYWAKSGERALARVALTEAMSHLAKGLEQVATLPDARARRHLELRLQATLGVVLLTAKGYAAPEVIGAFERARETVERAQVLGELAGDDPLLPFAVTYGLWATYYIAGKPELLAHAQRFLALARDQVLSPPRLVGHRIVGTSHLVRGEFAAAQAHLDKAVALYDVEQHRPLAIRFGQDIGVSALVYRAWSLIHLGFAEQALKDAAAAETLARRLANAQTLAYALFHIAVVAAIARNFERVQAQADELIALSQENGLTFWIGLGMMLQGLALLGCGRGAAAVQRIRQGQAIYEATGSKQFRTFFFGPLAGAYAGEGEGEHALAAIAEGFAALNDVDERWTEAEYNRWYGKVLLRQSPPDRRAAEREFEQALAVARRQEARLYELRATVSLARLWRDQGRRTEAYNRLAPVYGWFTEGFDTPDLRKAKALLDALR